MTEKSRNRSGARAITLRALVCQCFAQLEGLLAQLLENLDRLHAPSSLSCFEPFVVLFWAQNQYFSRSRKKRILVIHDNPI